jgi:TetR/AcrR family transcriptional regulator, cholesterol catabolism regulator
VAQESRAGRRPPRQKPGVKKQQIRETAIDYFGRFGYEETKWADVAAAVGIGSTALYHYYESKRHCLFEIMVDAVEAFRARFEQTVADHDDWTEALVTFLVQGFKLTDQEVMRLHVLVAEYARIATSSSAAQREEAARTALRAATRDLEWAWGTFLARGMESGVIPETDTRLLTRALLGLYNSVWQWYRPGSTSSLDQVGDFFVRRQLSMLGLSPELAERYATPV